MEILNYLGNILSEKLIISPPAARGLVRLAIKDELTLFKPLTEANFEDMKSVIKNSLHKRLIELDIQEAASLTQLLLDELVKNQSLFTMSLV